MVAHGPFLVVHDPPEMLARGRVLVRADGSRYFERMNSRYLFVTTVLLAGAALQYAQTRPTLSDQEKAVSAQMGKLRSLPDAEWVKAAGQIARQIQELPPGPTKTGLIAGFGNLCDRRRCRP